MTQKSSSDTPGFSYRDAGVDIDAGEKLVDLIKPYAKSTLQPGVLAGLGGFGALFELPSGYKQPVLVSGTDGVGTKLALAKQCGRYEGLGIDLVAMCVNDIIVQGARPLFFLDYYATGKLEVDVAATVIKGIAEGCKQSGAALIGGETAEMPGLYQDKDFDLAGFCVGIVEKSKIIDGSKIKPGDKIIGLASSGPHSNGYSLIRKIISHHNADLNSRLGQGTLAETLLAPTRIYVQSLLTLFSKIEVSGCAHITGGGLLENIPRVLPDTVSASIDVKSWPRPEIFSWLQQQGNINEKEMTRTFNCGIGMIVVVDAEQAETAMQLLGKAGETSWLIGEITARKSSEPAIAIS